MTAHEVIGPFPNSIEKGSKTFWYHKSYVAVTELGKAIQKLQRIGYSTHVIRKTGVSGLYTYPQTRWGMN